MDRDKLRELATDSLEPLISGAWLEPGERASTARSSRAAFADPCTIEFKGERGDTYRLALKRSQPFERKSGQALSEIHVVRAFVEVVKGMMHGLCSWYGADLRATFPRRIVARALCSDRTEQEAVLAAIDQMSLWAGQQYEGKPIPAAMGFVPGNHAGLTAFHDFCQEKFSAVVSNGFDTLVTCSYDGQVIGHETLAATPANPTFAPYRLGTIADWACDGRLALVLNRVGEVLVFRNKQLVFARRAGHWHFLTHEPLIAQMRRPQDERVRRAIYETCLDASLARSGACIGVITSAHSYRWEKVLCTPSDTLQPAQSTKTRVISAMVANRKFHELDRRLRQELAAIDGATILDHEGTILASGAIVKVQTGSSEGGRLAAAKELSKRGLGIKVSQDGRISGFRDGANDPVFTVM
jgi:DNA integrity scanning protein DisA with diadenylate cyclase activity